MAHPAGMVGLLAAMDVAEDLILDQDVAEAANFYSYHLIGDMGAIDLKTKQNYGKPINCSDAKNSTI